MSHTGNISRPRNRSCNGPPPRGRLTSPTSVISFAEKPAACAACSSADFSSGAKPIANRSRIASLPKLEEFLDDAASEIVTQMIQEQRWRKA